MTKEHPISFNSNYFDIPRYLSKGADEVFGIKISRQTLGFWQGTAYLIKLGDIVMDTLDPSERHSLMNTVFAYFENGEFSSEINTSNEDINQAVRFLRGPYMRLEGHKQKRYIDKLRQTCRVSEEIKQATTPEELAWLTRLEGQLTASLLLIPLTTEERSQEKTREFFQSAKAAFRFLNWLDTLFDFDRDYSDSQIKVPPTKRNKLIYAYRGAGDVGRFVTHIRPSHLLGITKVVVETYQGRNDVRKL